MRYPTMKNEMLDLSRWHTKWYRKGKQYGIPLYPIRTEAPRSLRFLRNISENLYARIREKSDQEIRKQEVKEPVIFDMFRVTCKVRDQIVSPTCAYKNKHGNG